MLLIQAKLASGGMGRKVVSILKPDILEALNLVYSNFPQLRKTIYILFIDLKGSTELRPGRGYWSRRAVKVS